MPQNTTHNIILEMKNNVILYGFCLMALAGHGQKCYSTMIYTATTALENYIEDWFPENFKFNESCVAEGCPALKNISLCPNASEIDALRNITEILNTCMKGPICGIIADARPLKQMLVSMEEFLPGETIDGNLTLLPDTGYLSNISKMQLDIPSNKNQQLTRPMTLFIPSIRLHGGVELDLRFDTLVSSLEASLKKTTYDTEIEFITTVHINKTTNAPNIDIRFVNPIVLARPRFCGIDLPSGLPDIQKLFTASAQMSLQKSSLAKAMGRFLEKLHRAAIQVASNNCIPLNSTI